MPIGFQRKKTQLARYLAERRWRPLMLVACAVIVHAGEAASASTLVLSDTYDTPYTTPAGDGFLDLVIKEAFERAGLKVSMLPVSPERALLNANAGIEDGVSARIAGLEKQYPNLVRVPEKVLDFPFVAFARNGRVAEANWAALAQVSVGHIHGWKIFEQNLKPGTQTTIVDTAEQLFSMLAKNRVDAALYERWLGLALARRMGINDIRVVEPALAEREMFVYLHKRHADKVPALAAAIRALKADGFYARVCREKFAPLAASAAQCDVK